MEVACAVHRTPSQGGGPHGLWTGSQSGRAAVEGTPFLYGPQVPVSCAPPGASCPSNDSNSNSNRGNNDKNRYIFYRLSTARNLATYEAERIFHSFKDEVTETRGLDPWPRPGERDEVRSPPRTAMRGLPVPSASNLALVPSSAQGPVSQTCCHCHFPKLLWG